MHINKTFSSFAAGSGCGSVKGQTNNFRDIKENDGNENTTYEKTILALGVMLATSFLSIQAQADQLADIKAAGVVKVATFDANPPFGSVDAKTHQIVGYDVDFAQALAASLGVKLELVATNPANRIPLLQSGKADLIVADITITPERAGSSISLCPTLSPVSNSGACLVTR